MMRPGWSASVILILGLSGCAEEPLARSIRANDAAGVAAVLDKGANLNGSLGQARMTPLAYAVSVRRPEMARLLLDRGADVNARHGKTTALTVAVLQGDAEMVRLLLSRGAEAGLLELNWAKKAYRPDIAALLQEAAAKTAPTEPAAPAVSTAAAGGSDAPNYRVPEHPDDFALVVGIEKYMDAPEAPFAGADARAFSAHLEALGWPRRNILELAGDGAGRAAFDRYIEHWLPHNVSPNSRFFFYFAGDGAVDAAGRAYLLPWDGDAAHLEATGYSLSRLYEKVNALRARAAFVVVDAGFSPGRGGRTAAAPGQETRTTSASLDFGASAAKGIFALLPASDGSWSPAAAAASSGATSPSRGALTHFLLEGLNGAAAAPGGGVTMRGLADYIRRAASEAGHPAPPLLIAAEGEADPRFR